MRDSQSVKNLNVSLKEEILRLEAEEKHLRAILEQHRPSCAQNIADCTKSEMSSDQTGQYTDQEGIYNFGHNINLDGGALDSMNLEENIDINHSSENRNIDMKTEIGEYGWKVNDSRKHFNYFGPHFDLVDTSCGNQSYGPSRFIGVDSRFIVL